MIFCICIMILFGNSVCTIDNTVETADTIDTTVCTINITIF